MTATADQSSRSAKE